MERYCGVLQRQLSSRRFPYACLDRIVYQDALLSHIKTKYNLVQELSFQPADINKEGGQVIAGCEQYCLSCAVPPNAL